MGTLADGIKEIFATAKTTGTNVMICTNNGTPDGHITMANLASVLGVDTKEYSTPLEDCNVPKSYIQYVNSATANKPENFGGGGYLVNISPVKESSTDYGGYCLQLLYDYNAGVYYYARSSKRDQGGIVWNEWNRIDNFGCNTPADLASLLGVLTLMNKNTTTIPTGGPANYGQYYQCKSANYQFNVVMGMSSGNCTGVWVAGANVDVAYENLVWHKLSWT